MKITKAHYEILEAAIVARIKKHPSIAGYKEHGLSPVRYVNDLLYSITLIENISTSAWICETIYPYANDDHLQTVLRNICKEHVSGYAEWLSE